MGRVDDILQVAPTIMLDKARPVWYGMKALGYLARKYGSVGNVLRIFSNDGALKELTAESMDAMIDFIFAGVMQGDKEITLDMIESSLGISDMVNVVSVCTKAFSNQTPQPEPGEKAGDSEDPTMGAT